MAVELRLRLGSGTHHAAVWLRDLANDGGKWKKAGCRTQQMAQKNITHLLEGQENKQGDMEKDGTGRYGKHHKKKTTLGGSGTRGEDGWTKTGCTGHGLESKRQTAKELAGNYTLRHPMHGYDVE